MKRSEQDYRRACTCDGCSVIRKALALLDDIATSPASMGIEDVEDLCEARALLAAEVGSVYSEETNRYE